MTVFWTPKDLESNKISLIRCSFVLEQLLINTPA